MGRLLAFCLIITSLSASLARADDACLITVGFDAGLKVKDYGAALEKNCTPGSTLVVFDTKLDSLATATAFCDLSKQVLHNDVQMICIYAGARTVRMVSVEKRPH